MKYNDEYRFILSFNVVKSLGCRKCSILFFGAKWISECNSCSYFGYSESTSNNKPQFDSFVLFRLYFH